jgi:hypothetical protein
MAKKVLRWRLITNNLGWETINEKYGSEESCIPKFERHRAILLVSMWVRDVMIYPYALEKGV